MKHAYLLVLLAGCAQTMTLYPRHGGEPITGALMTAEKTMTVPVEGETFSGSFTRGRSASFGAFNTYGSRPTFGSASGMSYSNQYTAILTSPSGKAMRCEFVGGLMEKGNGICQVGERVYDLLLTP